MTNKTVTTTTVLFTVYTSPPQASETPNSKNGFKQARIMKNMVLIITQ